MRQKIKDYNIDNNIIQKIAVSYFTDNPKRIIESSKISFFLETKYYQIEDIRYIDIYSPFFDSLSKSEIFNDAFITIIPMNKKKDKIKKDYISKFNELNKLNIKYTSLSIKFSDSNDIKYLKDFHINFNIIKNLEIIIYSVYDEQLLNKFLHNIEISNNLVYLSLSLYNTKISEKSLDINNFKSLEYLIFQNIIFNNFNLKINTLKKLKIVYCKGFILSNDIYSNLNTLSLFNYWIDIPINKKISFPNVEEIALNYYSDTQNLYYDFFEYKNMNKLIKYEGDIEILLKLESPNLDEIIIEIQSFDDIEKILDKINSFKYLKKVFLTLKNIDDYYYDLSKIKFENISIIEMNININSFHCPPFYQLQNNYTNLSKLFIEIINYGKCDEVIPEQYELIENPNSKVKNISFKINKFLCYKIYIQSYENLESIIFDISAMINLKRFFPIFNDKNNIKFESLKLLHLRFNDGMIYLDILNNIYNNLDNIPNLIDFQLLCNIEVSKGEFYEGFVRKILLMKNIKNIDIMFIRDNVFKYYSKKELQEIFPDINFDKYCKINIRKIGAGLFKQCVIY